MRAQGAHPHDLPLLEAAWPKQFEASTREQSSSPRRDARVLSPGVRSAAVGAPMVVHRDNAGVERPRPMDQPNSGQIDVLPTRDGWVVQTRGQVRESFDSHLDAINWACHLAKAEGEELVVHAVNWTERGTPNDQVA
jgi:hypothetical protein